MSFFFLNRIEKYLLDLFYIKCKKRRKKKFNRNIWNLFSLFSRIECQEILTNRYQFVLGFEKLYFKLNKNKTL